MVYLRIFFVNIIVSSLVLSQSFGSSGAIDARSTSLTNSTVTSSRGVYAIGINPANLAIEQDHNIEFSTIFPLPTINISAGNDFITLNDYQYFFTGVQGDDGKIRGRYLDNSEKSKFLALFDNGSLIHTNASSNLISFSITPDETIGAFGFAINDWSSAQISLPKQVFELLLYGNEPGKSFELSDFNFKLWYLRNYSFTYSRELTEYFSDAFKFLSAGLSIKLIHGLFYAGVESINTSFETLENFDILVDGDSKMLVASSPSLGIVYDFEENVERDGRFGLFNNPAGKGIGIDLGFYAEIDKKWSVAFALTDLGSVSWTKGLAEYSSSTSYVLEDITDETLVDSLKDAFTGEGAYGSPFSTALSTAMNIGVGIKLDKYLKDEIPGSLSLEFNYHQGFNNMPANSTIPRFALGAEWLPLSWFRLRSGISVGGYDDFNWAMGIGFNAGLIQIDIASAYTHSILYGNNAKRLGFAISSKWVL